jgi:uncharacterized protein
MNTLDTHKPISEELLNSFIDGQITDEERQEILALLERDKALATRVCELQRIKQRVKLAFDQIPTSQLPKNVIHQPKHMMQVAAAIAIFCLGIFLGNVGLKGHQGNSQSKMVASTATQATTKVLVHLTSSDSENALNTLTNLEQMLIDYRSKGENVKVEVVANGHGIDLLRQGITPFGPLIARLSSEYSNLSFAACKNTIDQMQISGDEEIELIPQAKLIDSGIVEVIQRQKEGWTYIRG